MRDLAIILLFVAMMPAGARSTSVSAMMWAWVALVSPNEYAYMNMPMALRRPYPTTRSSSG